MNWGKGFFRLWCMLSLCWIISIGVYALVQEQQEEAFNHCLLQEQDRDDLNTINYCSDSSGYAKAKGNPFAGIYVLDNPNVNTETRVKYVKEYAWLITLPPLITLAFGLLVAWVISGF